MGATILDGVIRETLKTLSKDLKEVREEATKVSEKEHSRQKDDQGKGRNVLGKSEEQYGGQWLEQREGVKGKRR